MVLCLQVGTSSVVYPAAGYAPMLAARGVPVAEFNLEPTPVTSTLKYVYFRYTTIHIIRDNVVKASLTLKTQQEIFGY